jgi:hypothetical protein
VIHCISLTNLPSQYGDLVELRLLLPLDSTPLADKLRTTDALCLQHCERILESSGLYWELCASEHRSIMSIYPLYHTAAIALTQMKDHQHQAYSMFERACSLMDDHVDEYPLALYLLQALRVVAERLKLPLSDEFLRIFRKSSLATCELTDVPVAIILPVPLEMVKLIPTEEGPGTSLMGMKVGDLISKRSSPESLDDRL